MTHHSTIEPANPKLTVPELIARARREHAACKERWIGKPKSRRFIIMHPIEAHLPPWMGRIHDS